MRTETFTRLNRVERPDGLGGSRVTWEDGERVQLFMIPCVTAVTDEAGKPWLGQRMLLFGHEPLPFAARVRRERDGTVVRVTADDCWEIPLAAINVPWQMKGEVIRG